tara:strand:+ start:5261 stop:7300 length:2040 start_codon:yes stop_codon:yes gene_type:complete
MRSFISEEEALNNMMTTDTHVRMYECAVCKDTYDSKKKLKKHHRKQKPRHHGIVTKLIANKTPTIPDKKYTKPKITPKAKKEKIAGDRSGKVSAQFKKSYKDEGALEPTYQSGFFRIENEVLISISEMLPDGCIVHTVPLTGHKIIEYDGDAYNSIDFLMYLHNFCELEMYYEDLLFCLNLVPQMQLIGIKDMNELGISTITYVEGNVIMTEFGTQSEKETITNSELLTSIAKLTGVAIVFGKFKKDSTIRKPFVKPKTQPLVQPKLIPSNNKQSTLTETIYADIDMDDDDDDTKLCNECDSGVMNFDPSLGGNYCDVCGMQDLEEFNKQKDELWSHTDGNDDNYTWMADSETYNRRGRGYGNWNQPTYTAPKPVANKFHPIFGIRGHNLLVDRIVDLTPIIEDTEREEVAEEFNAIEFKPTNQRGIITRKNTVEQLNNQSDTEDRLNVAILSVDDAYEWSEKIFAEEGLNMSDYIPHFRENYQSLQSECLLAIDIPRIDMPVIDPDDLLQFTEKLRGGALDVYEPYANGDELFSPKDLIKDTPQGIQFLQLGFQDGQLEDDVVNAKIMQTMVGLMRPTQSQIWLDKLIYNIIEWGKPSPQGAYNLKSKILTSTIAISQEGYILDGHHRYGQVALVNPSLKMKTLYIGLPITILIDIARPYGNAIGNEQRAAEDSTQTN